MESLYLRLGRGQGIGAVVDGFYDRVVADPSLAPFFVRTRMSAQRRHLTAVVAAATGGPAYRGRSLRDAHERLGIQRQHFDAVASHLVAELESRGVDADVIDELVAAIAPLADQVVTDGR